MVSPAGADRTVRPCGSLFGACSVDISKDITIEELVRELPASVKYLMNEGIRCIRCGEPIWGTLEQASREKGFSNDDIARFVDDLRKLSG